MSLGKYADIVESGGEHYPVYTTTEQEDPCVGAGNARFIDRLTDGSGSASVYYLPPPCIRTWKGEFDYVDYDLGNGLPTIRITTELMLVFEHATECSTDGSDCVSVLLTYDEGEGKWLGSQSWNSGTTPYEFYGYSEVDPETEEIFVYWVLHSTGCAVSEVYPDGLYDFLSITCFTPLTWTYLPFYLQLGYNNCCCNNPFQPMTLNIYTKRDTALGRLVDIADKPVYQIETPECDCPCTPSCCPGAALNEDATFTAFDEVTTSTIGPFAENCANCATIELVDSIFVIDNSYPWRAGKEVRFADGCFTGACLYVYCTPSGCGGSGSGGEPQDKSERWRNYHLVLVNCRNLPTPDDLDIIYDPTSGSCDPLSLTFTNIPFKVETSGAMCEGTFSVTVIGGACE